MDSETLRIGRSNNVFVLVALLAGLLPLAGINIAYFLSVDAELVPRCIPYLQGCTSISATGRHPPGSVVYRGTVIPSACFMLLYWYFASQWLAAHGNKSLRGRMLPWLGLCAAIFLVTFVAALGEVGDGYRTQRRLGMIGYVSSTFFAQLFFIGSIAKSKRSGELIFPAWVWRTKLALLAGMVILGLGSLFTPLFTSDLKAAEQIIEWNFFLLSASFFTVTGFAWYKDRIGADFSIRG
ncbi:MAG: hypothetical protein OER80_11985 [Gammaproteobacteria bacterium]|nr:hypothetical protein [Gammaproteobacteria bacterium]MDH3767949.1 hypothetical protein [Gammaproteobacteria bacterium]